MAQKILFKSKCPLNRNSQDVIPKSIKTALNSPGTPLEKHVRDFFEPRFGHDFGRVRVHTDTGASESAKALDAKAYTFNKNIFFGSGEYSTSSQQGLKLFAHELIHTIQQKKSESSPDTLKISEPSDTSEVEADQASKAFMEGRQIHISHGESNAISRFTDWGWPVCTPGHPCTPNANQQPVPQGPRPIEITVIDQGDMVGWLAAFFRTGEIYMTDVNTMVNNVLQALGNNTISRLNIIDHGNSDGIEIGSDWIDETSLPNFSGILSQLRGHFSPNGFVHIQHCKVGQNLDLIRALAQTFGAPVYAGTSYHNPVYRINFGHYVRCNPDGTCSARVSRP